MEEGNLYYEYMEKKERIFLDNLFTDDSDNIEIFEKSLKILLDKYLEGDDVSILFFGKQDKKFYLYESTPTFGLGLMSMEYLIEKKLNDYRKESYSNIIENPFIGEFLSMAYLQIIQEDVIIFKLGT